MTASRNSPSGNVPGPAAGLRRQTKPAPQLKRQPPDVSIATQRIDTKRKRNTIEALLRATAADPMQPARLQCGNPRQSSSPKANNTSAGRTDSKNGRPKGKKA